MSPRRPAPRAAVTRLLARSGLEVRRAGWDAWDHRRNLHFQDLGTGVVADVGAHFGEYASTIRRYGYAGRIVSFEPVSRYAEVVARAAAADPLWNVERCALGEESDVQTITVHASDSGFSSLLPMRDWVTGRFPEAEVVARESVEVRRLDDVSLPTGALHLKLDVQGFERAVLAGAADTLRRATSLELELSIQPLYEGQATYLEMLSTLRELGFELIDMRPEVFDRRLRAIEFDAFLVADERLRAR